MDFIKKVNWTCSCGKVHKLTLHWKDGIFFKTCDKCGKETRIKNKTLLQNEEQN